MLVHIFMDLLCLSLSWHEIRYRSFHPALPSGSGLQLLSKDGGARRGQLVPAAGAAADSPDQKVLVGDIGQVRSSPGGWCRWRKRRGRKSTCLEPCTAPFWHKLIIWLMSVCFGPTNSFTAMTVPVLRVIYLDGWGLNIFLIMFKKYF